MIIDVAKTLWSRFRVIIINSIAWLAIGAVIGYMNAPTPETKIETKIETQIVEKVVEKIVEKKIYIKDKTQTDTTIQKPDGTTIRTVTKNDIETAAVDTQKDTTTDTTIKQTAKEVKTITELPKYSVGVMAESPLSWPPVLTPEFNAGYRFFGNIWAEGSYNPSTKISGAGLKWEIK